MKNSWKDISSKGEKLYKKKIKGNLVSSDKGKFAAIDIKTEDFFVGNTLVEALNKARNKHPNHKFHTVTFAFHRNY